MPPAVGRACSCPPAPPALTPQVRAADIERSACATSPYVRIRAVILVVESLLIIGS